VGFYSERIVPHIVNAACGGKPMRPLRDRVCAGLSGEVVEIGFGSGHNVGSYPATVTRVRAVEPSDVGWKSGAKRRATRAVPIERAGLDGQDLPFDDDTFDAALSTFTLCTVPDASRALRELHRVLKPGASLHFLEHGLAPDEKVQRWQRRLDPLERRLVAGCEFSRPISQLVRDAGFTIIEIDEFYEQRAPKFAGALSLGRADAGR
jgi:ubiquinone/menaquinone biosynthesis C-methylase UbiE